MNPARALGVTVGQPVTVVGDARSGAVRFPLTPGHDYRLDDRP